MYEPVVSVNQNAAMVGCQRNATRALVGCGIAAGPLFLSIFVMQIAVRPEFSFTRSEPSVLSIGPLGWIQIANFIVAGLLIFAGALGMRRVLRPSQGGFWGPLLLAVFGIGQVGVGIFVVDPIRSAATMTFHGTMHIVIGSISFVTLMAACFVFVRAFLSQKQKMWAMFCAVTGLTFLAAFLGAASVSPGTTSIQLFLNVIFVDEWIWVSSISTQILGSVSKAGDSLSRPQHW